MSLFTLMNNKKIREYLKSVKDLYLTESQPKTLLFAIVFSVNILVATLALFFC